MRLTIINQFYTPDISPTAHLSASLAEHRAAAGDDVRVVASRGGYIQAAEDRIRDRTENPRVHRLWTPQLGKKTILRRCLDYLAFYVLALVRMVTLPRQDVIITLTTPPFIGLTAVAHKILHPSTKIILWNMDCYPEAAERAGKLKTNGFAAKIMRMLNRFLFRRLAHLVTLDTAMTELLMSQYGPKNRELPATVIPNWERADFFPPDAGHEPWERADALGLNGRFVILYLGNMGVGHRFETVLDAAEQLRNEPATFLFIGGGARYEEVDVEVKRRELANVLMHGYVPKEMTPSVMTSVDCALITLRDEALGVMSPSKLHSNLAMGLPVLYVGPEKSNVDDAIRRFDCGVSLRHGEVDALVAGVRAMMEDRGFFDQARQRARRAFDDAYCDVRTLEQFDRVLAEVGPKA